MKASKPRYVHTNNIHNYKAANVVVPYLISLLSPKSVVDVGCGTGTWLKVFHDNGVEEIMGIDGAYVDKSQLHINQENFVEHDLETLFRGYKKFDLAISLEVAEHLRDDSSTIFVETLTNLSDTIFFSAAIFNQGGQNHINEQAPAYWIQKFKNLGYSCFDVLRPVFWDSTEVDWWYRQNMMIFTKDLLVQNKLSQMLGFSNAHLVHPNLLQIKEHNSQSYQKMLEGKMGLKFYLKLLFKYFKNKFK